MRRLIHLVTNGPPAVFASRIGISVSTATRWAE